MNGSIKKRGSTWYYKFRSPQINPAMTCSRFPGRLVLGVHAAGLVVV